MKNIIFIFIITTCLGASILIFHFCFGLTSNETLSVSLQVFGGFIATYLGVYLSLESEDFRRKFEEAESIKALSVALNSELTVNVRKLEFLLDGIEKMPKKANQIIDIRGFFPMWVEQLESLKFDVFKGLLNSGDVKILTKDLKLIAEINIAYYNMGLLIEKGHVISRLIFDDKYIKNMGDLQIEDLEGEVKATNEVVKIAMEKIRKTLIDRNLYVFTDKKISKLRKLIKKNIRSKYDKN